MNTKYHTIPRWSDIRNYTLTVLFVMILGPFAFVPVGTGDLLLHRNPTVFWGHMIIISSWILVVVRNFSVKSPVVSMVNMLVIVCLLFPSEDRDGTPLFLVIILASYLFFAMKNKDR